MTALEVCEIWEQAVKARLPHMECRSIPLADGGEGMVDAYLKACGGKRITARVHGPFMEEVEAVYGLLPDGTAVLEMASCGGLPLAASHLDPLRATTYGVGELLLHSASRGAQRVLLGLGGSATNDGGMGMAAALGYTFVDGAGCLLPPLAQHMGQVAEIQPPPMAYPLPVIAACDVDNPLCGPRGATAVFGGQKGVTPQTAPLLEQGLANLAERVQKDLGKLVWELPGAGQLPYQLAQILLDPFRQVGKALLQQGRGLGRNPLLSAEDGGGPPGTAQGIVHIAGRDHR